MKLTPSQLAAVEHRGSNLLVAASAGSGKTEVLARRCVSLIADARRPCAVNRMLVVTFTRAAAAELRARIAAMLRDAADQADSRALRDHLRTQQVLIDTADIGTIDAWCQRIVREHCNEAGVDAEFAVLGEQEAALLRQETLAELFDWIYTSPEPLAADARGWIRRNTSPSDDFLRRLIVRTNAHREQCVDPAEWFARQHTLHARDDEALRADAVRMLAEALGAECEFQVGQIAEFATATGAAGAAQQLESFGGALKAWAAELAKIRGSTEESGITAERLQQIACEIDAFSISTRGIDGAAADLLDEIKARWLDRRLKKRWPPADTAAIVTHAAESAGLVATLLDIEAYYEQALEAKKRGRAVLEFGDVLRVTLDLLGTAGEDGPRAPTPIAEGLRQHYEHILVDEYQDTSPVQVEILRLVTRDAPGCGNRFMVGDVKQSIYGFRQAQPRLFTELLETFERDGRQGKALFLSDSFRSHAGIVEGLNRLFAALFDPGLGGSRYGEREKLLAQREEIPNPTLDGRSRIEIHVLERKAGRGRAGDDEEELLERVERETHLVVATLGRMIAADTQVPERTEDGEIVLRPLRLSDVAILLRAAKVHAAKVAAVLRDGGFACVTSGRESILDSVEVTDVRNVLALLTNRRQDLALAAHLRGPMVGLSESDLLAIRAGAPRAEYYDAVERYCRSGDDRALAERLNEAMTRLERWSAAARDEELPALLRRILRETELPLFARGLPGGAHRVAVLRALERLATTIVGAGRHGVAEFAAYLDELKDQELDPGAQVAGGEDAIRIMTIHGAKGLEFPLVFLLNSGARFNARALREPVCFDERLGLGLKFADYRARCELVSAAHHVTKYQAAARDIEEELRLLYVATTRARERLFVLGHTEPGRWEALRARYANASGPPPLMARLTAANMLEWVLMSASASGAHLAVPDADPLCRVVTHDADNMELLSAESEPRTEAASTSAPGAPDEEWVARGEALLAAKLDRSLTLRPSVFSVSAAKEVAARTDQEDTPTRPKGATPALRRPAFAADDEREDGRALGTACHRFLEFADLGRLRTADEVLGQVEALRADGHLTEAESAKVPVADLAWLGSAPIGRLLASSAQFVRREVPFVYALSFNSEASADEVPVAHRGPWASASEATILRGIIDCLIETDEGLVIVDYKTDRIGDPTTFEERVAGYRVQLQLYAIAAAAVFEKPVVRAVLVFLNARKVVEISIDAVKTTELLDALGRA